MLNLSDPNALVANMASLRRNGKLWMFVEPEHECDKKPLTDEGKETVVALIELCLQHNITPFCSISGENGSASSDIVSLNPAEYDDLIAKIAQFTAPTRKPPESYRDIKRPSLLEAMRLEGGIIVEAVVSLERKGYFEPPPGPWKLGVQDRGMGRANFAVLDRFDDLVVEAKDRPTAELIISAVNTQRQQPSLASS